MNINQSNILVPIDFSEQSQIALEYAFHLARKSGSHVYLLHVLKVTKSWMGIFSSDEQLDFNEKIKSKLLSLCIPCQSSIDTKVIPIVRDGKLLETILDTAKEIDAQLIVVGTHPSDNFKQKVIGHNAYRLVKESTCPVITIKGKVNRSNCDNIVLPLDLTKETREKVSYAVFFAKLFNAKVHVVSVITTSNEEMLKKLNAQMQQVVKFIKSNEVDNSWSVIRADNDADKIASKLLEYAESKQADMVIIMTQQEMEIYEYFIGSTASEIIATSEIPVLSVIPKFRYNYVITR
jgi:nucleotide-binding universal stress UspA family protein